MTAHTVLLGRDARVLAEGELRDTVKWGEAMLRVVGGLYDRRGMHRHAAVLMHRIAAELDAAAKAARNGAPRLYFVAGGTPDPVAIPPVPAPLDQLAELFADPMLFAGTLNTPPRGLLWGGDLVVTKSGTQ